MKKISSILLSFVLSVFMLAALSGCANNTPIADHKAATTADITVVTDNFAAWDWARNVIGDVNTELILLGANGADMHSYQPTARDFAELADCDLFIYIGGESDSWADDAMQQTASGAKPLALLAAIGSAAKTEQIAEGMTADEHDHTDVDPEADDPELDEHIWLSLANAMTCTQAIANALAEIDPANTDTYTANAAAYCEQLFELDTQYRSTVTAAAYDTILVADRFPFVYLVDDYGLNWHAAYPGCSAETGASFETVKFLSDKLAELKLPAVITCENADTALAETIIKTAGASCPIIELDSLQSINQSDIDNGKTYIKAMTENLAALNAALN